MTDHFNDLGQPIGFPLENWKKRLPPPQTVIEGQYCRLEPLNPAVHAADLYQAYQADSKGRLWTYLSYGPFITFEAYETWLQNNCLDDDPLFYTIIHSITGQAVGVASYLRIEPNTGVIEVGHINYSPQLQKTPAATEAMFLMMRRVFDELGYRRYEWKCDALNAPSRRAALRLGFTFEGIFRQATMYKNRNRDTAWYSIIDKEWPALKTGLEAWLNPANFDVQGQQRQRLADFMSQAKLEL